MTAAVLVFGVQSAAAATFNPNKVISNDNMRAYDCMSEKQIQAFLDSKTGPLKTLVTPDHNGTKKKASKIIYEACRHYHISPKVMLTMLQKEQSLLTRTTLKKNTLDRAIGAGCPNSTTNKYPGFGNQIWNGARLLDGYGEGKSTSYVKKYKAGITYSGGSGRTVKPANIATYKLYVYNPSIGAKSPYGDLESQKNSLSGNASFWYIYKRYFGNPNVLPPNRPVWRFFNKVNGSFLYTSSPNERYGLLTKAYKTWKSQGKVFTWKSKAKANNVRIYRFTNKDTNKRLYTTSASRAKQLRAKSQQKTWRYEGVEWKVSRSKTKTLPVWRFYRVASGGNFYTADPKVKNKYKTALKGKYQYKGVVWYVAK
ncbi:MAG: hypothetical protein HY876_08945 [Coriobacteriales bacterium]|nr:hypothetical protein [Coriobacteriales bacterium]